MRLIFFTLPVPYTSDWMDSQESTHIGPRISIDGQANNDVPVCIRSPLRLSLKQHPLVGGVQPWL